MQKQTQVQALVNYIRQHRQDVVSWTSDKITVIEHYLDVRNGVPGAELREIRATVSDVRNWLGY